ncbi:sulfite oxidase heme-binding subunit YedZ [Roseateles sp. DAIF2]|uniref:sulfite oxidase heme-binding subunit YedZ n=1 Tax=Roseateles sp. DAIF2 TaxID=2714952 RepID=UPI0018A2C23F|nr:protein-methionine-sulfoxide reductase heme-binding subunit MsrQ [Roseateles sp. DAIF2]
MAPPTRSSWLLHPAAKVLLFVACLLPFAQLLWGAVADTLGANPAEALIRGLGDWALRFLCLTLAVTPARLLLKRPALARFRRMLGLYAFFYASLHLLAYGWLDQGLDPTEIARDIAKRPFILMGFTAWALMLPLAATSFNRAIKALGARRWQTLHKAVYGLALVALAHFIWMRAGKNDFAEPAVYGAILALLLGWRAWRALVRPQPAADAPARTGPAPGAPRPARSGRDVSAPPT